MKHLTLSTLVLGALSVGSVVAVPSHAHHQHRHQHAEKKRQNWDDAENYTGVDFSTLDWAKILGSPPTSAPVATTAPTSAASAASVATATTATSASASASASSSSSGSSSGGAFGGVTEPVSNGNPDTYVGNLGNPYGSNILAVAESEASSFQYVNKITNNSGKTCKWVHWLKASSASAPNGGQFADPVLSTDIPSGGTQHFAYDTNTQGGGCCWDGTRTSYGAFNCLYLEFNYDDQSNQGWSAFDASSIQTSSSENNIAMTVSACGQQSQSGNNANSYSSDKQANGLGCNCPAGSLVVETTLG